MKGSSSAGAGYFWLYRLDSLSGVVIVAAYLVFFLIPYSSAIGGAGPFNRMAAAMGNIPLIDVFLTIAVGAPLAFHSVMGLVNVTRSQANVMAYPYYRNCMYALQRLTGLLALPFIVYHVTRTELGFAFTGKFADFLFMHRLLGSALVQVIYVVGVASAAVHVGNGLVSFLIRWGIVASRKAQDAVSMAMWVLTFILAAWGVRIVLAF